MRRSADIRGEVAEVSRIWLTRKDAAKYLGVSVKYIQRLNDSAQLRYSKVGGLVFIRKEDIDRLLTKGMIWN